MCSLASSVVYLTKWTQTPYILLVATTKGFMLLQTAGIGGGLGVLSYMLYGLKNKPANQKMSVYLIHTRLGVQGTVIGMLTVGMIYHVWT